MLGYVYVCIYTIMILVIAVIYLKHILTSPQQRDVKHRSYEFLTSWFYKEQGLD